ncbi:uncharacterized protein METZ01_LOCUS171705 [marine metagenome]|uniref:Uncharacterized protein n=1 Tax=marine metagenome TaxID=408172 RepID=A0A382BZC9_9ZZZZ
MFSYMQIGKPIHGAHILIKALLEL